MLKDCGQNNRNIASGEPVRHGDDDGPTSKTMTKTICWLNKGGHVFAPFRGFGRRKREMKYTADIVFIAGAAPAQCGD
jgi:hypothetical protein